MAYSDVQNLQLAIDYALRSLGKGSLKLKEAQYDAIQAIVCQRKDVLAVLPTGFGKSLIYQTLGLIFDFYESGFKEPTQNDSIIIVVSPLNALMQDQVEKIKDKIDVCIVKAEGVCVGGSTKEGDETFEKVSLDQLKSCQIVFAHPEALVNMKHLRSKSLQDRVKAIVIDEAHLVVEWKDFRPAYGKLGALGSYFLHTPIIGLTATATKDTKEKICQSLGLLEPVLISVNPDRENIYFASHKIKDRGGIRLETILSPLVSQLKKERLSFPLTLIYSNLSTISECYQYFSDALENEQYHPIGAVPVARNRLFSQFHAQYPEHERMRIVRSLVEGVSTVRVLFVTVAFGIGIDVKDIRQVIHIGVPYTVEEYFQEAGRCGRDGFPSKAVVYFNSYDISMGKKHLSDTMRNFVQGPKCKREILLSYFGYEVPARDLPAHTCCDSHQCTCDDCVLADVSCLFGISEDNTSPLMESVIPMANVKNVLSKEESDSLRSGLEKYRSTLHGSGRSCVGGITLATGFSLELIDQVVEQAVFLTSVEEIKARLPLFSNAQAKAIFEVVRQVVLH